MGKAYFNVKSKDKKPKGDLYSSPFCCTWRLLEYEDFSDVLEPANGLGAISKPLKDAGIKVRTSDISTGQDFLNYTEYQSEIVTNPPFYLWNNFVWKAKSLNTKKFAYIGRVNYFGTHERHTTNLFGELRHLYIFDRMIDYQTPYREDGLFHVGGMVTAWFIFEKGYKGKPVIDQLDVQEYAKLGSYNVNCTNKDCKKQLTRYDLICPKCSTPNKNYIGEK